MNLCKQLAQNITKYLQHTMVAGRPSVVASKASLMASNAHQWLAKEKWWPAASKDG